MTDDLLPTSPHVTSDDEFQKELVELFAQEAQEWLVQIKSALDELGARPSPERQAQLLEHIVRGVTNLGGSAATVNLPDVERAAYALLPFVETIRSPGIQPTPDDWAFLRQNYLHVITALKKVTGMALDELAKFESDGSVDSSLQPATMLQSLRDLRQSRVRSSEANRNLADVVIKKVEADLQRGTPQVDVVSLQLLLERLKGADQEFLNTLHQHMPLIVQLISRLKQESPEARLPQIEFAATVQGIEILTEAAQTVHAETIFTFMSGLQSFLNVVSQRRLTLAKKRFEAVETRVNGVIAMARQWVEVGRIERTAIGKLLPT